MNQQLVKFLMSEGIHPGAIETSFFINFLDSVAEHSLGNKLPHSLNITLQLASNIIKKKKTKKKEVYEYIENVIKESIKTCCILIYKIRYGKELLLDIYAYTPIGVACIKTFFILDVKELFCLETTFSSIIGFIGPTNVVQLIINDNDENKGSKDMLCYKYPWIYLTRYATSEIKFL